ncbi:MAG: hypothetical protein RXQ00_07380, partial [Caldivirga sp.]
VSFNSIRHSSRDLLSWVGRWLFYARSEPYEVDVTEEYVINELHGLSNVKVAGSGNAYSALVKRDLWSSLGSHDLLIMKGLDNFETYLELKPGWAMHYFY